MLNPRCSYETTTSPVPRTRNVIPTESPCSGTQAPWTAARCTRLLRPLSSKISLLRKLKDAEARKQDIVQATVLDGSNKSTRKSGSARTTQVYEAICEQSGFKEEWNMSPRPRKRIRHTYSTKGRPQASRVELLSEQRRPNHIPNGSQISTTFSGSLDFADAQASDSGNDTLEDQDSLYFGMAPIHRKESASSFRRTSGNSTSHSEPTRQAIQSLARHETKDASRLYDGIFTSFVALLQASDSLMEVDRTGCRSLFSSCLRRVPEYIFKEQVCAKIMDPDDDTDMSAIIYSDLEAMSVVDGWKPLRKVVRAHGIGLVGAAVEEKLIPLEIAGEFVSFCVGRGANDDGELLIENMIASFTREPKQLRQTALNAGCIYKTLQGFASRTRRYGFFYQQLTEIIEKHPGFLDTSLQVGDCWDRLVYSLAQQDDYANQAAILFRTVVRKPWIPEDFTVAPVIGGLRKLACRAARRTKLRSATLPQTDHRSLNADRVMPSTGRIARDWHRIHLISTTLQALLSAVTIIRQSNGNVDANSSGDLTATVIREMSLEVRQFLELASYSATFKIPESLSDQLRIPLLASGIVSITSGGSRPECSTGRFAELDTLASCPLNEGIMEKAGSFVGAIARYCERETYQDAFTLAQTIVQSFTEISTRTPSVICKETRILCRDISVAAAFAFSEVTGQPSHLEWALEVEQAACSKENPSPKRFVDRTPARKPSEAKGACRWEEGICEWIVKTPAVLVGRQSASASRLDEDEADADANADVTPPTTMSATNVKEPVISTLEKPACGQVVIDTKGAPDGTIQHRGFASIKCVRIVSSAACASPARRPAKRSPDSNAFQKIQVYDDADELSAPSPLPDLSTSHQRRSPTVALSIKQHPHSISVSNIPRLESGRYGLRACKRRHVSFDQENLELEDELSF